MSYENIIREVANFKDLTDNWDGYGGKKITTKTIEQAIYFIKGIREASVEQPLVFPRTNNEVAFYWQRGKFYLEVSVGENSASYFLENQDDLKGEDGLSIEALTERIENLLEY